LGDSGNDSIEGGGGHNNLYGIDGDDTLVGGADGELLDGGTENDQVIGNGGGDNMRGGEGTDSLDGGDGRDILDGGAGADTLVGGAGLDAFIGGEGADQLDLTDPAGKLETDHVEIDFTTDFGDVITGFNTTAPASGGDELDIRDLLLPVGTVADAVSQGYLSFSGDPTQTTLSVDLDGAAGAGAPVVMCTFVGVGFVDSTTSQNDFADNIFTV
jgi:Ca2+-binding RTX toxin-like protein